MSVRQHVPHDHFWTFKNCLPFLVEVQGPLEAAEVVPGSAPGVSPGYGCGRVTVDAAPHISGVSARLVRLQTTTS